MDAKAYLESYAALKMEVRMSEDRILEAYNDTLLPAMTVGVGSQRTPGMYKAFQLLLAWCWPLRKLLDRWLNRWLGD